MLIVVCSALTAMVGCGTSKGGKQKDEFFTSGSREADQRATQRMAKEQQLGGSGGGEKEAKKAKPPGEGSQGSAAQAENKLPLFERLGGEQGLVAIVDDFTPRAVQDPRVNWQRKGLHRGGFFRRNNSGSAAWNPSDENVGRFKKHFVQLLALATGGPAQYDGKEMKSAHAGMNISNAEFDAVIGDLKASLDKLQIPNKEQKELLAVIESTRPQIVTER